MRPSNASNGRKIKEIIIKGTFWKKFPLTLQKLLLILQHCCKITKVLREFERSFAKDLSKQKPKNGSLSASEQARNTQLARCRIVIEHTFAHLKKWHILADRYRGLFSDYAQIFQTIAGIYNLSLIG